MAKGEKSRAPTSCASVKSVLSSSCLRATLEARLRSQPGTGSPLSLLLSEEMSIASLVAWVCFELKASNNDIRREGERKAVDRKALGLSIRDEINGRRTKGVDRWRIVRRALFVNLSYCPLSPRSSEFQVGEII